MSTLMHLGQIAGEISAIVAVLSLIIKPLRERIFQTHFLKDGLKGLLRSDMLRIFYAHREDRVIRQYELENFIKEYETYRGLGGNSFMAEVYEEVMDWRVTP